VKVPLFFRIYRVLSYTEGKPGEAEALETLAQALGGDSTSALYRKLVVEKRLASDAGASYDGYNRESGEFSVYAIPRPGVRLEQLEKGVDEVIKGFSTSNPEAPDFDRAKTQLIAAAAYRRDSQYEMAAAYGQALAIGLTTDDVDQWPARVKAVPPGAVRAAAARQLNRREAVSAYLTPAEPSGPRK
jgi:zinc protease